jgi:hypothetical protein
MVYNLPDHISGDTWKGISSITIKENNSAVDLTDCDIFIQFRTSKNLASPVFLEMSNYNNKVNVIIPSMGVISITEQEIDMPIGEYDYDLQVNFPVGTVKTYLKGKIKILPHTTRTKNNTDLYSPIYNQKLLITELDDDRILTIDGERMNYI